MTTKTIRSPVDWTGEQVVHVAHGLGDIGHALGHAIDMVGSPAAEVRRIGTGDLRAAMTQGWKDFAAYRTDLFFLLLLYPLLTFVIARFSFRMELLPLLFPLISGLALVGSFAAVGLYEMSRRREQGEHVTWWNGFEVIHRPAIGGIAILGLIMTALFAVWMTVAWMIFNYTMGMVPASFTSFYAAVFGTSAGWTMIGIGVGVGFLFALLAMTVSVVAFPMLVDRDTGFDAAVRTSWRAVRANPMPMAMWGLMIAASLLLGAIPLGVGLIVVLPVLGHATWHLYRKLVPQL